MEMSSKRLRARVERYLNFGHGPDGVITRNNYSQKKKKSGGLVGRDILNKLFTLNHLRLDFFISSTGYSDLYAKCF